MEVLHVTPSSNGYEIVTLLANAVHRNNTLAMIEKNGELFMTGGFLINNTPEIRAILDALPKEKHYEFVKSFKSDPFVKMYYYNSEEEAKKAAEEYESNRRVQA